MKNLKSKTIRDESIQELMAGILNLFSNELTTPQKRILTERLINNRSFKAVKDEIGMPIPRQKVLFQEGMGVLNSNIYKLGNLRDSHLKLKDEHQKLSDKFDVWEGHELAKFSPEIRQRLNTLIEQTTLFHRVFNVCKSLKINRVSDIVRYYPHDFLRVRTCGKQSLIELENFLAKNGLNWGMLK